MVYHSSLPIPGSWYHYLSIILSLIKQYIATVYELLSYNDGSWYHYLGISLLVIAKIIATVYPSSFVSSGLWLPISGIIPKHALSNIDIFYSSYHSCGYGRWPHSSIYFNVLPQLSF